jgi:hypothetical protein
MPHWVQNGPKRWELQVPTERGGYRLVGKVVWCGDVDGGTGWAAWGLGAPKPVPSYPAVTYRPPEKAGDFRSLRDAMRHVMVLYKLEQ